MTQGLRCATDGSRRPARPRHRCWVAFGLLVRCAAQSPADSGRRVLAEPALDVPEVLSETGSNTKSHQNQVSWRRLQSATCPTDPTAKAEALDRSSRLSAGSKTTPATAELCPSTQTHAARSPSDVPASSPHPTGSDRGLIAILNGEQTKLTSRGGPEKQCGRTDHDNRECSRHSAPGSHANSTSVRFSRFRPGLPPGCGCGVPMLSVAGTGSVDPIGT